MVVQKVQNNSPHMGFTVLEWFAHESRKFDHFLDTKTLISSSMVMQKLRNNPPHMGFNILEWFVQES